MSRGAPACKVLAIYHTEHFLKSAVFSFKASLDAAVPNRRHREGYPQTAQREEHQDSTGLLQPPDRAGAGAARSPCRPL